MDVIAKHVSLANLVELSAAIGSLLHLLLYRIVRGVFPRLEGALRGGFLMAAYPELPAEALASSPWLRLVVTHGVVC